MTTVLQIKLREVGVNQTQCCIKTYSHLPVDAIRDRCIGIYRTKELKIALSLFNVLVECSQCETEELSNKSLIMIW